MLTRDLDKNAFTGTIPKGIGNCSRLVRVLLYENQLSGTIPESFGSLTNLEHLYDPFDFRFLIGRSSPRDQVDPSQQAFRHHP